MPCTECGSKMIAVIRERGRILWECPDCDNVWIEPVYIPEDE